MTHRLPVARLCQWLMVFSGFLILLLGCNPKIDPSFGPDGQPRVLAAQLAGIFSQNIQINQDTRQIQITLPTNFSATSPFLHLQLTPDTRVATNYTDSLQIYPLVKNDSIKIVTSAKKSNTYSLIFKPAADLSFATLSAPLTVTITPFGSQACLPPLYNFIDGQQEGTLILTNQQTGHQLRTPQAPTFLSSCDRKNRTDGGVVVALPIIRGYDQYEPGDYTAEFVKPNGRRTTLSQLVRLQPGPIELAYDQDIPVLLGGSPLILYVANVFPADQPSLLFRSRGQTPVSVQPKTFQMAQLSLELPVLTDLRPGYYYVQLLTKGQPTNAYTRIPVAGSASDLVINAIYPYAAPNGPSILDPAESFDTPITLIREKRYVLRTNAFAAYFFPIKPNNSAIIQVHLTSLTDPRINYLVPYDDGSPFTLPATLVSGRYQFKSEIVKPDKTVLSSAPLERDVIIN